MNGGAITWLSKRQPVVIASTPEADISQQHRLPRKQCGCMRVLLTNLWTNVTVSQIMEENQSSLKLLENSVFSMRLRTH